jgi:hypothetical protein
MLRAWAMRKFKRFAGHTTRFRLIADKLGLLRRRFQHDVGFALLVEDIAADDLLRRLELAIDAAVPLFQPRGFPWQIEMYDVQAIGLEVEAKLKIQNQRVAAAL